MKTYQAEIGHDICCFGTHTFEATDDEQAVAWAQSELDRWDGETESRFDDESTDPDWDSSGNKRVLWVRRVDSAASDRDTGGVEVCGEVLPSSGKSATLPARAVMVLEHAQRLVDTLLKIERRLALTDLEFLRRMPKLLADANVMPLHGLSKLLASVLNSPQPVPVTVEEKAARSVVALQVSVSGERDPNSVVKTPHNRYRIEASNSDPATRSGHERDSVVEIEFASQKSAASTEARKQHRRGYWVEIYSTASDELLSGPFDPDRPAPRNFI